MDDKEKVILEYIEQNEFVSPEFRNVGLPYLDIVGICENLIGRQILKKRDCVGLAYELK